MTREETTLWLKLLHTASLIYEEQLDALDRKIESLPGEANHDGCDSCRYEQNTEYEYPCNECKQRYKDRWKQKPNDFIEVVRCKNCKHYSVKGDITLFGWCGYWNRPADEMVYCSFAERREESEVEE